MNSIEILKRVDDYEYTHNVQDYIVDGWHVWPLLKTAICLQWLPSAHPLSIGQYTLPLRRYFAYFKAIYKKYRSAFHKVDASKNNHSVDVTFLTLSERRVMVDGAFFEIYSDPFVDILSELGFTTLVWEVGDGRPPQYSESIKILNRLNVETSLASRNLKEPDWFVDYEILVGNIIGREIVWAEIAPMIAAVTTRSIVFERWLRKSNARFLFLVCWYDPLAMSAIMAARRCGVKTVEIQHGVQGKGHFAYSSWSRIPVEGYEVVPDVFWCWGETFVEELHEYNPGFFTRSSAVAGGNLWLNRWRQSTKKFQVITPAGNELDGVKKILVSLQLDVSRVLLEAISASPSTWLWMIRFHPSRRMDSRAADMEQCLEIGHPGVEFERSNKFLLYDLLNDCDVHVTESSSCALEALAFGVQSVIVGGSDLGEDGKFFYRQFIEKKLMLSADTASDLIDAIISSKPIDQSAPEISDLFADDNAAKASLSLLLRDIESIEVTL